MTLPELLRKLAAETEIEQLRQIVLAEGADPDLYIPSGLSKPELRAEAERLRERLEYVMRENTAHDLWTAAQLCQGMARPEAVGHLLKILVAAGKE